MHVVLRIAFLTLTIILLARFLPGIRIRNTATAVLVAVVFSALNWLLGGLLATLLILPTILTLGLLWLFVPFIVNTALLWATDKLLHPFEIKDGRTLLLAAGAITLANGLFRLVF